MFTILTLPAAIVKPADAILAPVALDYRAALEADYAAADLDDCWIMDDATADRLAYESECQDRYESGCYAW